MLKRCTTYGLSILLWISLAGIITTYFDSMNAAVLHRHGFFVFWSQLALSMSPYALMTPILFEFSGRLYQQSDKSMFDWVLFLFLFAGWYFVVNGLCAPFELVFWRSGGTVLDVLFHPKRPQFLVSVLSFLFISGAGIFRTAVMDKKQKELALAEAESLLNTSRMQQLRERLNPHFLFNSLNSAISYVRTKQNDHAEDVLLALSDLMEIALAPKIPDCWTLKKELDWIDKMMEIASLRFGEKMGVLREIQSKALEIEIPSLLLQPLIENAIVHGVCSRSEPTQIYLLAEQKGEGLYFLIENECAEQSPTGHGLGLQITRKRFQVAYRDQGLLNTSRSPDHFRVEMLIPLAS